jgi:uncharacterized protein YjbI with pentapeptide repeats
MGEVGLSGADLRGTTISSQAKLDEACATNAATRNRPSCFTRADLNSANLSGADLQADRR